MTINNKRILTLTLSSLCICKSIIILKHELEFFAFCNCQPNDRISNSIQWSKLFVDLEMPMIRPHTSCGPHNLPRSRITIATENMQFIYPPSLASSGALLLLSQWKKLETGGLVRVDLRGNKTGSLEDRSLVCTES